MKSANKILVNYLSIGLKAAPWVIGSMLVMITIAKLYIKYTTPFYQSTSKLKIDEGTVGISKSNLYKDFDLFTTPNKIMTEIEVIKSTSLIKKTLENLNFGIEYYQIGSIKTTELYNRSPFIVKVLKKDKDLLEKEIKVTMLKDILKLDDSTNHKLGDTIFLNGSSITIHLNEQLLKENRSIQTNGSFKFIVKDEQKLAKQIKKQLDITAVDKDISVVRVSYQHKIAQKTTEFVNQHVKTYIKDYIDNRTNAANKSVQFLQQQLDEVSSKLIRDENKLEQYKLSNNIINTKQETESGIRKTAQLNIKLSNIEMKKAALDSLDIYINSSNKNFLDLAPHFEVFGDMLYVELIKQIQGYRAKRKELLINYTIHSQEIKTLDSKLEDLIAYFKESVKNSKENVQTQKYQVELAIIKSKEEFKNAPTIEKNLTALKREFEQTQKLYTFLSEKKSEASLAKAASYSFHQILETAEIPQKPTSPNKTLITFVCGFLGILIGIGLFYLKTLLWGNTIKTKEEIEKNFSDDSFIVEEKNNQELAAKLLLKKKLNKNEVLLITTLDKKTDGLSQFENLGKSISSLGWNVLLINFDFTTNWELNKKTKPLHEVIVNKLDTNDFITSRESNLHVISTKQVSDALQLINHDNVEVCLNELKELYDIVLVFFPQILSKIEAVSLSKKANHTICFTKSRHVNIDACTELDLIKKEYDLTSLSIVLEK
jgi:uncharacterized protein involved in exopolysaccharide biosynthesis